MGLTFRRDTLERYERINHALWTQYSEGRISGARVKVERFRRLLLELGENPQRAARLGRRYLAELGKRGDVLPGARQAVRSLARRFPVAIVTNGFERVQRARLRRSGLAGCFDAVITSEAVGHAKPDRRIVQAALRALGVDARQALFVGDDLRTDQGAARAAGVRFVWVDRGASRPTRRGLPRLRVRSLRELAERLTRGDATL